MVDDSDEEQLVAAARRGDAEAIARLYRCHVDEVYAFAWRRFGSAHDADDITAATFERLVARIDRFEWRGAGSLRSWLYRVAAREAADHARRARRDHTPRARATQLRLAAAGSDPGPESHDVGTEDDAVVRAALGRLRPRYEQALTLVHVAQLEPGEAAAVLGVSRSTFAVVVHRARVALRRELDRVGVDGPDTVMIEGDES